MEESVKQIISDIFELNISEINEDMTMDDVKLWDSMNHINLVLAIEEEFSISLDVSDIEEMISFYDIISVLQQKV